MTYRNGVSLVGFFFFWIICIIIYFVNGKKDLISFVNTICFVLAYAELDADAGWFGCMYGHNIKWLSNNFEVELYYSLWNRTVNRERPWQKCTEKVYYGIEWYVCLDNLILLVRIYGYLIYICREKVSSIGIEFCRKKICNESSGSRYLSIENIYRFNLVISIF